MYCERTYEMTIYHKLIVSPAWDYDVKPDILIYKQKSTNKYLVILNNYQGKFRRTGYTSIQQVLEAYTESNELISYECMTPLEYKNHLMMRELVG